MGPPEFPLKELQGQVADRDAQITALELRVESLESALARSAARLEAATSSPAGPPRAPSDLAAARLALDEEDRLAQEAAEATQKADEERLAAEAAEAARKAEEDRLAQAAAEAAQKAQEERLAAEAAEALASRPPPEPRGPKDGDVPAQSPDGSDLLLEAAPAPSEATAF